MNVEIFSFDDMIKRRGIWHSRYNIGFICLTVLLLMTATVTVETPSDEETKPLSPTDFVIDDLNSQIIVAQKTGNRVDFIDLTSGLQKGSIPTPLPPTGICYDQNGLAYITCSHSTGEVLIVDVNTHKVVDNLEAGHGAICPVLSPDSDMLYVANQYDDDVSVIDLNTKSEISRIPVLRQPMTMDITPDGRWLLVANLLPATRADVDTVAADVSIIDLRENRVVKHLKLSNGSNALRGINISPDGKHAFVAHNLGRFQVPTSQLEQGWMNTSALSIIEVAEQRVLATILLDEPENGAASSWGVDVNDEIIAVTHSGTHDYSLIGLSAMLKKLESVDDPETLSYDLSFLTGIRRRIPVDGNGPRAIKIAGDKVITALYFSDALQIDNLVNAETIARHTMNPNLSIDSVRMGEIVFNDARHCFQQWQACTGCHPNDARTDGLNWDLLNDGIGNPKNCKSLLLSHETPPSMITGVRPTAEVAVRAGFRHIQFALIEESDARAVDLYLRSLKPVPSPRLVAGELSEKALLGKTVFETLKCSHCHPAPYYADGLKHKIGTPGISDRTNEWDTPTLLEVWRTGPYLHDGRSATLKDVFKVEKHGIKEDIEDTDIENLVEYLLSL